MVIIEHDWEQRLTDDPQNEGGIQCRLRLHRPLARSLLLNCGNLGAREPGELIAGTSWIAAGPSYLRLPDGAKQFRAGVAPGGFLLVLVFVAKRFLGVRTL